MAHLVIYRTNLGKHLKESTIQWNNFGGHIVAHILYVSDQLCSIHSGLAVLKNTECY